MSRTIIDTGREGIGSSRGIVRRYNPAVGQWTPTQGDGLRAFVMPDSGPRAVIVDETGHRHAFPSLHAVIVPACYLNGGAS